MLLSILLLATNMGFLELFLHAQQANLFEQGVAAVTSFIKFITELEHHCLD